MVNGSLSQRQRNLTIAASLTMKEKSLNPLFGSVEASSIMLSGATSLTVFLAFCGLRVFKNLCSILEIIRTTGSASVSSRTWLCRMTLSIFPRVQRSSFFIPSLVSFTFHFPEFFTVFLFETEVVFTSFGRIDGRLAFVHALLHQCVNFLKGRGGCTSRPFTIWSIA